MGIRHVVSLKLASTDSDEKAEQAAKIREGLNSLVGVVDEIRAMDVGADVVGRGNWDVVLIADFDDLAALDRYQVHPEHKKVLGYVKSVSSSRVAVDFER